MRAARMGGARIPSLSCAAARNIAVHELPDLKESRSDPRSEPLTTTADKRIFIDPAEEQQAAR